MSASVGETLAAEYVAAVWAKDPVRLAAIYAPDVRVFDTWGMKSFEGREAWTVSLNDWLGSLGAESVRVEFDDMRGAQQAGMGWFSAEVTYSAMDSTDQVLRSMQNRLSWALVKDEGGWRIAHEHTSVPIGPDLKGVLKRG